jgi:hypothetical protein
MEPSQIEEIVVSTADQLRVTNSYHFRVPTDHPGR